VTWHLHRLWAVRCDIVHSAEFNLSLVLLCANLEYYLKSTLYTILSLLRSNGQIGSLQELFERVALANDDIMGQLKSGSADLFDEYLRNGTV
jgi:hypothetical protein